MREDVAAVVCLPQRTCGSIQEIDEKLFLALRSRSIKYKDVFEGQGQRN